MEPSLPAANGHAIGYRARLGGPLARAMAVGPRLFAAMMCGFVLTACTPGEIRVTGSVDRERNQVEGERPRLLAGGTVEILDETGVQKSKVTTDDNGKFRAVAPSASTIFAEIRASDSEVVSSFTGVSGVESPMQVEDHALFAVSQEEIDTLRDKYTGCSDAGGAIVYGEVRVVGLEDPETGESPLVTSASISTTSIDESETHLACYLDDAGSAYAPEATTTGDAGEFAVFGVGPGMHTLVVEYTFFEDDPLTGYLAFFVPDGDSVVVPRYPIWVEFPL